MCLCVSRVQLLLLLLRKKMLFRKWLAVAVGVFWLSFWTLFLQVDGGKHHRQQQQQQPQNNEYSDESAEWDWKVR